MKERSHKPSQESSHSTSTPAPHQCQPRPFPVQAQPEPNSLEQQETPDSLEQLEKEQRFGFNFANVKVYPSQIPPSQLPTSPLIQPKLTIKPVQTDKSRGVETSQPSHPFFEQVYAKNQQRQTPTTAGKVEPIVEYIRQNAIARASVHQNPSIEQQQETPSSQPQQQKSSHVGFSFANVAVYPSQPQARKEDWLPIADLGSKFQATAGLQKRLADEKAGGSPLAEEIRTFREPRFGNDFSSAVIRQSEEQTEPETDQAADLVRRMPENSTAEEVTVSGLPQTIGIQRLCDKCQEEQQQQLVEEDKAQKNLQAKELPDYTPEVAPDLEAQEIQDSQPHKEPTAAESVGNEASHESLKSDNSQAMIASKLPHLGGEATSETAPPNSPQAPTEAKENALEAKEKAAKSDEPEEPQSVEIVAQREPSAATAESVADAKAGDESSPVAEAMEAAAPPDAIELPREAAPQIEGDKTKGQKGAQTAGAKKSITLKSVPEAQVLEEAVAGDEAANLNPKGSGEAASPETVAQKQEATASAEEAKARLETTNAEAAQLACTGISFALPQQEETAKANDGLVISRKADNPGGDSAFLEQQRAAASSMASGFLANAAGRVQTITSLGQTITPSIQSAAELAKASIMAAIEQQRAAVSAQIAQVRTQAQSEAQAALSQIGSQHQTAVAAIGQTTTTSGAKVETGYTTALTTVDERESNQIKRIDELYAQADKAYRAAGTKVGDETVGKGEKKAKEYESQVKGEDDSLLDGPVTDDRLKARAKAARDVAGQYKQGLIEEANKQADAGQKGKSKDIETVRKAATESRKTLASQHKAALDSLSAAQEQSLSQAQQAQTSLSESANKTRETTLQSLQQQEAAQLQMLADYGQRQILAIDRDAQKAIASLQDGVNQAASNLQSTLQGFQREMQGMAAPDPQALSAILAETMGQIDGAIATVQSQLTQGIASSVQGITQGNQQTLQALTSMGQGAIEESTAAGQGLTTTLTSLTQGATDTFTQLQQTHTTTVTTTADTAVAGFGQVTDGVKTLFDQIDKNLENGFKDSAKGLEDGLRGALDKMDADIQKYGDDAAAQVQPRWKGILKIILVIAVLVVVALVVGPAVIGAVGAAAGALGASAATASAVGAIVGGAIVGAASGAVIQMGNNVIDGKNLMDGVGKAALVGAIGGALGGAGGVLGNAVVKGAGLTQSLLKVGIDMALDTAGNILGDLASGNPITLEGILTGAAMGLAMSVGMGQLGKIKSIEGIQGKSFQVGEGVGGYAGGKIKSGFGGGMDVPTGGRPDVDLPSVKQPETEVKAPETEVKAPDTEVKAPDTEVKAPNTEVKAPDTEVKAPETEVKAPDTEVKAPETEVKAPDTEVKAPDTEVKAPETDTPNGRSTHADEPEVEPGVVAKEQTPDGHEIKVLKDGRVVRCSDCGEIRNKYAKELEQPELKQRLDEIEKLPDSNTKVKQARDLEIELAQARLKNRDDLALGRQLNESDQAYLDRLNDLADPSPRQKPDGKLETEDEGLERALAAEVKLKEDPLVQDIKTRSEGSQENLGSAARTQTEYDQAAQGLWTTKTGKPDPVDLGGGKKVDPLDPSTSKQDIENALKVLESRKNPDSQTQQRIHDLRTRLDKSTHNEHVSSAQQAFKTGDQSDEAIVKRILDGEEHVWCGNPEQAQRVSNLLEEVALPDGPEPGHFHGPEKHTGSAGGPKEIHLNVKLKYNGRSTKSHIYYPEE